MIRAGWVQSKHVKTPAVNILWRRGKWLYYWCILVVCVWSLVWCPIYCPNTRRTVRFIDGAYPEAVYNRCRLVWYGCCVGPLEHPGIMQCLYWVQLKFRCWHCAANSSQELFIEILQSPCPLWKDVLKREEGSCFTAQGSCLCFLRLWL